MKIFKFISFLKRGLLNNQTVHLGRKRVFCVKPTSLSKENSDKCLGDIRTGNKRRRLTLEKVEEIHGGLHANKVEREQQCLDGLWYTLVNSVDHTTLKGYLETSESVKDILTDIVNTGVSSYETSLDNTVRSVSVLYEGGILSKRKYNLIRSRLSLTKDTKTKRRCKRKFLGDCKIPSIKEYKKLIDFIKSVDIGQLNPMPTVKAHGSMFESDANGSTLQDVAVKGCYRPFENLLLKMADLYLFLDEQKSFLVWFGQPKGKFCTAIGADGAPFGRENEATSWLVSFLNVGERIASCNENMLLAGANCKEDHPCMNAYAQLLRKEIEHVQKQSYLVHLKFLVLQIVPYHLHQQLNLVLNHLQVRM